MISGSETAVVDGNCWNCDAEVSTWSLEWVGLEGSLSLVRSRGQKEGICTDAGGERAGAGYTNDLEAEGETVECYTEIFQHQSKRQAALEPREDSRAISFVHRGAPKTVS